MFLLSLLITIITTTDLATAAAEEVKKETILKIYHSDDLIIVSFLISLLQIAGVGKQISPFRVEKSQ